MTLRFFNFGRLAQGPALRRFARAVCRSIPQLRRKGELSVILLSDRKIRAINRAFLDHDRATDVIAFRYGDARRRTGGDALPPFGDIYISLDTAGREARRGRYPREQEVALLLCHGLLHLTGYRDDTKARQRRMFARQKALLAALAPRLAPPDFR